MVEGYDIEVRLLAITGLCSSLISPNKTTIKTSDSEQLVEYAGRLCWDTTDKLGENQRRIKERIEVGHE